MCVFGLNLFPTLIRCGTVRDRERAFPSTRIHLQTLVEQILPGTHVYLMSLVEYVVVTIETYPCTLTTNLICVSFLCLSKLKPSRNLPEVSIKFSQENFRNFILHFYDSSFSFCLSFPSNFLNQIILLKDNCVTWNWF